MSAWCRKTLVGIQPTCRQVPPRNGSFSTTAVFNPHWLARIAATYPPGPLPMITRSYLAKFILPDVCADSEPDGPGCLLTKRWLRASEHFSLAPPAGHRNPARMRVVYVGNFIGPFAGVNSAGTNRVSGWEAAYGIGHHA